MVTAAQLLDWYLALASLLPQSTEPLLDEPTLRQHMETMGLRTAEDGKAARAQKKASEARARIAGRDGVAVARWRPRPARCVVPRASRRRVP